MAIANNILFAPDGEQYNLYTQQSPVPGFGRGFRYPMGVQLVLEDGRKFRFAENGGTLLAINTLCTGAAILTTDQGMTPAAGAVGDQKITFTHGAATTAANFFAEGFALISSDGNVYKIKSHLALRNATAGDVVNFDAGFALRTAITGSSTLDLLANIYSGVVVAPATTIAQVPIGVAVSAIPATLNAGWLQTRGQCGVKTSGTLIAGTRVVSALASGAVGPETATAATSKIQNTVGAAQNVSSGAFSMIYLQIDG